LRRILVLCLFALALSGSSSAQVRVSFLAMGDYGVGGSRELTLGLGMKSHEARNGANWLVALGDNDYLESPRLFRANWQKSFGWVHRRGLHVGGVLGNHDYATGRGGYELATLQMPGRYYTRRLGDGEVQLFFLDSNRITGTQTAWLEQQLSESAATWKIAVLHHPPYTCGGHLGNVVVARRWVSLFEEYGVQLVLSGHDHNYQRFASRNGVTYIVHGGGAAGLYPLRRCPGSYPRRARALVQHGFLFVAATDEQLDVSAVDLRGRVTDQVRLAP
jgi:Calcineurin-like phosphoesterase